MRIRWQVIGVTTALWCLGVVLVEGLRIHKVLTGPPDLEEYVNHIGFQLVGSLFLVVTKWLPVLCGVLLVEVAILGVAGLVRSRSAQSQ